MKTTTLKLADAEWVTLKEVYLFHPIFPNKDGLLDVDDVDGFREFLNDEMSHHFITDDNNIIKSNSIYKTLNSILSKLDK